MTVRPNAKAAAHFDLAADYLAEAIRCMDAALEVTNDPSTDEEADVLLSIANTQENIALVGLMVSMLALAYSVPAEAPLEGIHEHH